MTYSETQFQRVLIKVLNRISNELHESNVLTKKSVEMQERMLQINEASSHQMSIKELKTKINSVYGLKESEDNKEQ